MGGEICTNLGDSRGYRDTTCREKMHWGGQEEACYHSDNRVERAAVGIRSKIVGLNAVLTICRSAVGGGSSKRLRSVLRPRGVSWGRNPWLVHDVAEGRG